MEFILKRLEKGITSEIVKNYTLDKEGISEWLKSKNLIYDKEFLTSFNDLQSWRRTGGETYSTIFEFTCGKEIYKIFVKAIVSLNPEKSLIDWNRRRNFLKDNYLPVSNWFWVGEATIFEQYYPNDCKNCDPEMLMDIAFQLDKLGFTTLKFLDDIRCDESNLPFIVDFGFDLGEPSQIKKKSAYNFFLLKYPELEKKLNDFYNKKL